MYATLFPLHLSPLESLCTSTPGTLDIEREPSITGEQLTIGDVKLPGVVNFLT